MRTAMSDCMCKDCSLANECWYIVRDGENLSDEEAKEAVEWDFDCLIDSDCSRCSCYDECCERS